MLANRAEVRVLLEAKADMRIKDSLGATALMISIQHACYQSMLQPQLVFRFLFGAFKVLVRSLWALLNLGAMV